MLVQRSCFAPFGLLVLALFGCGAAGRSSVVGAETGVGLETGAETDRDASAAAKRADPKLGQARGAEGGARRATGQSDPAGRSSTTESGSGSEAEGSGEPAPPAHDPAHVRQALDGTASAPDERARLGVRLAIVDQGPNAPWLLAIANRGTEPVRINPDLRTLTLEITPKPPEPAADKKPVRAAKPAKPTTCALPKDLFPSSEDPNLRVLLEPGEALVDHFDPRLYCLPLTTSPLKPGARVIARLGWPEKTKTVWKKGKSEKVLVAQAPPFIAELAPKDAPLGSLPAAVPAPLPAAAGASPTDQAAGEGTLLKQLVANPVELGDAYAQADVESDAEPLALQLTRGSDARTERDATLTVSIVNRSKLTQRLFFRRELLTFEISGPRGLISCQPGPDDRAPDRRAFQALRPGGRISATSRLVEMCPAGAMRTPGLYLVHARFDSDDSELSAEGSQLPVYHGRLLSQKPATVRVRRGWGVLPPQHQPMKVRLGTP